MKQLICTVFLLTIMSLFLLSCTASLSSTPTPEEIQSECKRIFVGPNGVVFAMDSDQRLHDHILEGICSGSDAWLNVARQLYPGNNAHMNEEISSAVAVALSKNPRLVLQLFKPEEVCHEPDFLPAECRTSRWIQNVKTSLKSLRETPSNESATFCMSRLQIDK